VKVTVRDVNDNAPQFESDTIVRRIFENQPLRSVVSPVIRATDADLGDYAKVCLWHILIHIGYVMRRE